ncbi:MAG TPA: thioredoxin family protein [Vicinamibacterales bacterium]|nr:thioredoxin family protein [Vicinamibacterales bacterium]
MGLLSDQDRETVRARLAVIRHPVQILFFTQTIGAPESVYVTKRVIDELVSLNDHLSVEEVNLVLDRDRAAHYEIEHIPAIVLLRNNEDTRMRFLGAPAGYEFMSLIEAVVLAGTDDSGLSTNSRTLVTQYVTSPLDIRVFVTPTCPHCPRAVTLAHRLAVENPLIRAACVEATEFMDLAQRFNVTGVPKTVVNESIEILGALPEDQFVRMVVGAPDQDGDGQDLAP